MVSWFSIFFLYPFFIKHTKHAQFSIRICNNYSSINQFYFTGNTFVDQISDFIQSSDQSVQLINERICTRMDEFSVVIEIEIRSQWVLLAT